MSVASTSHESPALSKVLCASRDFGVAACNPANGPVGWSKVKACAPCPKECMTCEDRSATEFKCNLYPVVPFREAFGMVMGTSGKVVNEQPYTLPRGFDCHNTEKRNSDDRLYKTDCAFPASHDI